MVTNASGYRHRQGKSFGGNRVDAGKLNTTYRRRYFSERNKTAVMVICTPSSLAWPLLALHLAMLTLEGALLSLMKRDGRVWREIYGPATRHVLRGFHAMRTRRREQQRMRSVSLGTYFRAFTVRPRKFVLLWRHGLPAVR